MSSVCVCPSLPCVSVLGTVEDQDRRIAGCFNLFLVLSTHTRNNSSRVLVNRFGTNVPSVRPWERGRLQPQSGYDENIDYVQYTQIDSNTSSLQFISSFNHFLAATALITPKLFLHVWLGTRMFQLMDRDERAQLDGWAKALNVVYIAVGSAVGVATGWVVWSETKKVLAAIEREQRQGLGDGEEHMPLLSLKQPVRRVHVTSGRSSRGAHFVELTEDSDEEVPHNIWTDESSTGSSNGSGVE